MPTNNEQTVEHCRHFKFEDTVFDQVIAHGGSGSIITRRVLESRNRAINFVDLTVVPVGSDIGVHTHTHDNEEIYIVISGEGEMELDDSEFKVGPGHVVVNRPGGTHGLRNTGKTDLQLVVIEVPVPSPNKTAFAGDGKS
jgi:mannose-6-phosphate isomerase-like protein (cupin superfamily)